MAAGRVLVHPVSTADVSMCVGTCVGSCVMDVCETASVMTSGAVELSVVSGEYLCVHTECAMLLGGIMVVVSHESEFVSADGRHDVPDVVSVCMVESVRGQCTDVHCSTNSTLVSANPHERSATTRRPTLRPLSCEGSSTHDAVAATDCTASLHTNSPCCPTLFSGGTDPLLTAGSPASLPGECSTPCSSSGTVQ